MGGATGFRVTEARFEHFEVPVTELVPCEFTNGFCCLVEVVAIEQCGDFLSCGGEAAEDPAVFDLKFGCVYGCWRVAFEIEKGKAAGVPEFVAEISSVVEAFADNSCDGSIRVGCKQGLGNWNDFLHLLQRIDGLGPPSGFSS